LQIVLGEMPDNSTIIQPYWNCWRYGMERGFDFDERRSLRLLRSVTLAATSPPRMAMLVLCFYSNVDARALETSPL